MWSNDILLFDVYLGRVDVALQVLGTSAGDSMTALGTVHILLRPGHYDIMYPDKPNNPDGTPFFSEAHINEQLTAIFEAQKEVRRQEALEAQRRAEAENKVGAQPPKSPQRDADQCRKIQELLQTPRVTVASTYQQLHECK
jgi:hypothetical protein